MKSLDNFFTRSRFEYGKDSWEPTVRYSYSGSSTDFKIRWKWMRVMILTAYVQKTRWHRIISSIAASLCSSPSTHSTRRLHKWVDCKPTRIDCSYCAQLCACNHHKLTRCVTAFEEHFHEDVIHWWSKWTRMTCRDRSNLYARERNISNQVPLKTVDTTVALNKAVLTP